MKNRRSGFTLIELLVVVAIVSILAGMVIKGIKGVREERRVLAKSLNAVQTAKMKLQSDPDSLAAAAERSVKTYSRENTMTDTSRHLYVISSVDNRVIVYLYQQDAKGEYHQYNVAHAGQVVLVTDRPLAVKDNVLTIDTTPRLESEK